MGIYSSAPATSGIMGKCQFENLEARILMSGTKYIVDSLEDTVAQDGYLTLREAIEASRTNTAVNEAPAGKMFETDSIYFAPKLFADGQDKTLELNGTELEISGWTSIYGPETQQLTIDANNQSRIFSISNGRTTIISRLKLTGGNAIYGGAIQADGDLTISDTILDSNYADYSGGALLFTSGNLYMASCRITNNSTGSYEYSNGGGISANGYKAVFSNCYIADNFSGTGGGISSHYSSLEIKNSTVTRNSARYDGGGISHYNYYNTGEISNSYILGNSAGNNGGGIYLKRGDIFNTVIARNTAGNTGGGVYRSHYEYNGAYLSLIINSTIIENHADISGGVEDLPSNEIHNCIITSNTANSLNNTNRDAEFSTTNLIGIDPLFIRQPSPGSDGWWGTEDDDYGDLSLQPFSPAISSGNNFYYEAYLDNPSNSDIAGNPRIANDQIDMGAYESLYEAPSAIVTSLTDIIDYTDTQISLREAIQYQKYLGGDVNFDGELDGGTIHLTEGAIIIDSSVNINTEQTDITIDACETSRIFSIAGYNTDVSISNLTLTNGRSIIGGAILVERADVELYKLTITNCTATINGGAIYSSSDIIVDESFFTGNHTARMGGAIYSDSNITISKSIFRSNSSGYNGGALFSERGLTDITNSEFCGNTAASHGGAIYNNDSNIIVTNTTISGNYADETGGLHHNLGSFGFLQLNNSIVALNSSEYGLNNLSETFSDSIDAESCIIGQDPGFVRNPSAGADNIWGTDDDDLGDLRLAAGSAAIDAGDTQLAKNSLDQPLTQDILNNDRISGQSVDIGAYEFSTPELPADINDDGTVNIFDFLILKSNYGTNTQLGLATGDINGDGTVDIFDFLALKADYGNSVI